MTRTVWLPYPTIEQAAAAVGHPDEVEIAVFPGPNAPIPDSADRVELIALPNAEGPASWQVIRDRDLPRLRLLQLGWAGYDHMLPVLPEGVSLANAGGVHDAGTAELAVALALANGRELDRYARDQTAHIWQPGWGRSIADRQVLIFGYGRIGAAVERRLAGFEPANVTRIARTAKTDPAVYPVSELATLLPAADLVVITAPATPQTIGIFDAAALALLPDQALVVNVGRGPILVTEAALAEAGRLRFALDVVDPEPLPADHPLWDAPGVTLSPHVGGQASSFQRRYDRLLAEQIRHLVAGEPFASVVAGPGA